MVRKPASMYRDRKGRAYTRKEFMGGIPGSRISQFEIGDLQTDFPVAVHLIAEESCQVRNQALEAARISTNRHIAKWAGSAYRLKIRVFPHHVLRENKVAVGAGADRISDGMRAAFGTPVGTAARVKAGQRLLTIFTTEANVEHARVALRKGGSKLPTPWRLEVRRTK